MFRKFLDGFRFSDGLPEMRENKNYALQLPSSLYGKMQEAANRRNVTVSAMLKAYIKLGLLVTILEDEGKGSIIYREDGKEEQILKLF